MVTLEYKYFLKSLIKSTFKPISCLVGIAGRLYYFFIFAFLFAVQAIAVPGLTTYQARIVKPDGQPLEANGVSFRFTFLNPAGSCILYIEDYSAVSMANSGGLISFSLGSGTKTFPTSASVTFKDVFNNATPSMDCMTSGTYSPGASDTRKIVMQFRDTSGWQTLPAMAINAVPYAMYATQADNSVLFNGKTDTAFVEKSNIPTCLAGQALHYNLAGFTCVSVGGASGTISASDVTTALGYSPVSSSILSGYTPAASYTGVATSVGNLGTSVTAITSTLNQLSASMAALSGGGITSFNGSTSATQSFQIVSTGLAANISTINGVHTLAIPNAASASVTAGLLSNADYLSFSGKLNATSAAVIAALGYTPAASGSGVSVTSGSIATALGYAPVNPVSLTTLTSAINVVSSSLTSFQATTAASFAALSGSGIGSFNGSSSATQSLGNALTGTTPAFVTVNGVHTLNIPYASAPGTTAGLISNSDYSLFSTVINKITSSAASIAQVLGYTPADQATVATLSSTVGAVSTTANAALTAANTKITSSAAAIEQVLGYMPASGSASVNSAAITSALGYTPADAASVTVLTNSKITSSAASIQQVLGYVPADSAALSSFQLTTAASFAAISGSGISSLNGSTSATQNFANGTGGTAPAFVTAAGVHTLNIPFASAGATTAGVISNADYSLFSTVINKITSSAASIAQVLGYTPADQATVTTLSSTVGAVSTTANAALTAANTKITSSAAAIEQVLGYMPASGSASVNSAAITSALGYTPADAASVTVLTNSKITSSAASIQQVLGYVPADSAALSSFQLTTAASFAAISGSGISSLNGSTSATQNFANGTGGTAPAFVTAAGVHTLNIPFASAGATTAGVISNADYSLFSTVINKITSSAASIAQVLGYTPADQTTVTNLNLTVSAVSATANSALSLANSKITSSAASIAQVLGYTPAASGSVGGLSLWVTSGTSKIFAHETLTSPGSVVDINVHVNGTSDLYSAQNIDLIADGASVPDAIYVHKMAVSATASSEVIGQDVFIEGNANYVTGVNSTVLNANGYAYGGILQADSNSATGVDAVAQTNTGIATGLTARSYSRDPGGGNSTAGQFEANGNTGSEVRGVSIMVSPYNGGTPNSVTGADIFVADNGVSGTGINIRNNGHIGSIGLRIQGFSGGHAIYSDSNAPSFLGGNLTVSGGLRISMESAACSAGLAGTIRYNGGIVEYCNGTIWSAFGVAGAGITNFNGSASGSQSLANALSGTTPAFVSANGVHTLNIPYASVGTTTAGLISNAEYALFSTVTNKITSSAAAIAQALGYTPADAVSFTTLSSTVDSVSASVASKITSSAASVAEVLGYAPAASDAVANLKLPANSDIIMRSCPAGWTDLAATSGPSLSHAGVTTRVCRSPGVASLIPANSIVLMMSCPSGWTSLGITSPAPSVNGFQQLVACQAPAADSFVPAGAQVLAGTGTCPAGWSLFGTISGPTVNCNGSTCRVCESPGGMAYPRIVYGGTAGVSATGAIAILRGGAGGSTSGNGGSTFINGGSATDGHGGAVTIAAGTGATLTGLPRNGGLVSINSGNGVSAGVAGNISLQAGTNSVSYAHVLMQQTGGNVGIGLSSPVTKLDVSGAVRISMDSAACDATYAGTIRYNAGTVEFCNGSAWAAFGAAGSGLANFNGSTSATQTFASGNSGTAPSFSTVNGVHTLNIPFASEGTTTAGVISNSDYSLFSTVSNKITSSAASIVEVLGYTPAQSASSLYVTGTNTNETLTASAAGQTRQYTITGSTKTITLPDGATLPVGWEVTIQNISTSVFGVNVSTQGTDTFYGVTSSTLFAMTGNSNTPTSRFFWQGPVKKWGVETIGGYIFRQPPGRGIAFYAGNATIGSGQAVTLSATSGYEGAGGAVNIIAGHAGSASGSAATGGAVNLTSGNGVNGGNAGAVVLTGGTSTVGVGGAIALFAGTASAGYGGDLLLRAGTGTVDNGYIDVSGTIRANNSFFALTNGTVGIGAVSSPTARLHLASGTTTMASLKLSSGALLTAPQAGAIEYDGFNFYTTDGAGTRSVLGSGGGNTLAGYSVSATAPVSGQVLTWNAALNSWMPTAPTGGSSQFTTSGTSVFYTSGNTGYGTSNPVARMHVASSTTSTTDPSASSLLTLQNTSNTSGALNSIVFKGSAGNDHAAISIQQSFSGNVGNRMILQTKSQSGTVWNANQLVLSPMGFVGIGVSNPTVALDVVGDIQYTGTITDASDRRLKDHIEPLGSAISKVRQIKTYSYVMKDDPNQRIEYGVMAQDMLGIIPNLVKTIRGDYYGVNYVGLIPWSIKAIQEVDSETQNLRRENAEIKRELASVKEKNQALEQKLDRIIELLEQQNKKGEK